MENLTKLFVSPTDQIRNVISVIDKGAAQVALVVNSTTLIGIVTDGDIRRGILKGKDLDTQIHEIMQKNFKYLLEPATNEDALSMMKREGLSQVPLLNDKGNVIKKADDNEARYYLVPDSILSVKDGAKISAGDVIARLPKETTKTKDITGGLPRVAELFEARKAKDSAIIAENDGRVIFGKEVRGKQRVTIEAENGDTSSYLIPKGKHINFNQGEKIKKGEYLLDGQPLPHDILRILGIEELTEYFVNQVQDVYRLQGVIINDKHIETILRQMLKKIEVKETGDSKLLPGEVVDRVKFETMNEELVADGKKPAVGERILMGITKASLQTESFISAASFQETTRVLTDAAIKGKVDKLTGLKENVIVGRLVPAGTGAIKNSWNKKAINDDQKFLSEQESSEASEAQINQ